MKFPAWLLRVLASLAALLIVCAIVGGIMMMAAAGIPLRTAIMIAVGSAVGLAMLAYALVSNV